MTLTPAKREDNPWVEEGAKKDKAEAELPYVLPPIPFPGLLGGYHITKYFPFQARLTNPMGGSGHRCFSFLA
ncbi:hypothetical protein PsorP6_013160 [Peronosclerospora sorghi]|uniref:Uncharacterized protein n=1 Tax=Peronosclerospora sorghi TaxID=230839 RepID=A0ACC0WHZ1_9STRA|nr:hypothetical protein PsorP6_013160 [Peronosclerospora sorghi]